MALSGKKVLHGWMGPQRWFATLPRTIRYPLNLIFFAIGLYIVFDITDWTDPSGVPDQMDRLETMQAAFYRADFESLGQKRNSTPEALYARLLEGDLVAHTRVAERMLTGEIDRTERQFVHLSIADRHVRWGKPEKALHRLALVSGGFAEGVPGEFEKAPAVLTTLHPELQAYGWSIASEAHLLRMETTLAIDRSEKALTLMEGDSAKRLPEIHYTMRHRYLRALADGYSPKYDALAADPQFTFSDNILPMRYLERIAYLTTSRIAPVERAFMSTFYDRFLDLGDFDKAHYFHGLIAVRRAEAELRTGNAKFAFQYARDGLGWADEHDPDPSTIRLDLQYLSMQAAQASGDSEKVRDVAATLFDLGRDSAGNGSGTSILSNVRGLDAQFRVIGRDDALPLLEAFARDEFAKLNKDSDPWFVRVFDLIGRVYTNGGKQDEAAKIFETTASIRDARGMTLTDEDLSAVLWHSDTMLRMQRLNDGYQIILPLARIAQNHLASLADFDRDGDLFDPFASRRQTFLKQHYALIFERLVYYLSTIPEAELSDDFRETTFTALQHAQGAKVQQSVSRLALRKRAPNAEAARLLRERQDTENELERLQIELERLRLFEDRPEDDGDIRTVERRIRGAQDDAAELGTQLVASAGDFTLEISTAPLTIEQVQSTLEPGQVVLTYMNSAELNLVFGWAITRDKFRFSRLPLRLTELDDRVKQLRSSLGSNAVLRGAELLDDARDSAAGGFNTEAAHALYQALVAPFADVISAGDTLLVQADGSIASLPYALLLTEPADASRNADALRAMQWLVKSHPTVTLPSLNYLQIAAEQRAEGGMMDGPFIGFGNPALEGGAGEVVEGPGFEDGLAIPDAVKRLEPLPNTERELQAMAATLGAERSTITTGNRATEYNVRNTDFTGASVVTFATHGLLSGEISGLPEPALVFTPPWIWSTRNDDGLLLMSELRQMKLDANWVIFSACNTAGGSGDGQEGLSGLASAALYAGAERLLVSHWAVRDDATADLTTAMMQILMDDPTVSGSAALQRAMLLLMTEKDSYASPDAWAAFVVVGGR